MSRKYNEMGEKGKRLLVLYNSCGHCNDEPLSLKEYGWVRTAAYMDVFSFCSVKETMPKLGDVINVRVTYPFCCREGEYFSVTIGDDTFITMRLLNIKRYKRYSAKLRVRVDMIGGRWSFVKPLPEGMRNQLRESKAYDYISPRGDTLGSCGYISERVVRFSNNYGGGDICYEDFIYTDNDGIDHLVQSCYRRFGQWEAYFGDRVLGCHEYSPYFLKPEELADGAFAPGIPIPLGFIESLTRMVLRQGIVEFLQTSIKATKNNESGDISFGPRNDLYTCVTIIWVTQISVEGFVYAIKKVIEKLDDPNMTFANEQIANLYNGLIRELTDRSLNGNILERFYYRKNKT